MTFLRYIWIFGLRTSKMYAPATHCTHIMCAGAAAIVSLAEAGNRACVLKCTQDFADAEAADGEFFPLLSIVPNDRAVENVNQRCERFDALKTCLDSCNGRIKGIVLKAFAGYQVYCERKAEILQQIPCLANTNVTTECASQILATRKVMKDFVDTVADVVKHSTKNKEASIVDAADFKPKLTEVCRVSKEETKCTIPVVAVTCGSFSLTLINDMFSYTLKGIQDITHMGAISNDFLPSECVTLMAEDLTPAVVKFSEDTGRPFVLPVVEKQPTEKPIEANATAINANATAAPGKKPTNVTASATREGISSEKGVEGVVYANRTGAANVSEASEAPVATETKPGEVAGTVGRGAAACFINCSAEFGKGGSVLGNVFPPLNEAEIENTTATLNQRCKDVSELDKCTDACANPSMKAVFGRSFEGLQELCNRQKEFGDALPCIAKTSIGDKCQQEISTSRKVIEKFAETINELTSQVQSGSLQGPAGQHATATFRTTLADTCGALTNEVKCTQPIIDPPCGDLVGSLVRNAFTKTLEGVEDMASFGLLSEDFMPPECTALLQLANATGGAGAAGNESALGATAGSGLEIAAAGVKVGAEGNATGHAANISESLDISKPQEIGAAVENATGVPTVAKAAHPNATAPAAVNETGAGIAAGNETVRANVSESVDLTKPATIEGGETSRINETVEGRNETGRAVNASESQDVSKPAIEHAANATQPTAANETRTANVSESQDTSKAAVEVGETAKFNESSPGANLSHPALANETRAANVSESVDTSKPGTIETSEVAKANETAGGTNATQSSAGNETRIANVSESVDLSKPATIEGGETSTINKTAGGTNETHPSPGNETSHANVSESQDVSKPTVETTRNISGGAAAENATVPIVGAAGNETSKANVSESSDLSKATIAAPAQSPYQSAPGQQRVRVRVGQPIAPGQENATFNGTVQAEPIHGANATAGANVSESLDTGKPGLVNVEAVIGNETGAGNVSHPAILINETIPAARIGEENATLPANVSESTDISKATIEAAVHPGSQTANETAASTERGGSNATTSTNVSESVDTSKAAIETIEQPGNGNQTAGGNATTAAGKAANVSESTDISKTTVEAAVHPGNQTGNETAVPGATGKTNATAPANVSESVDTSKSAIEATAQPGNQTAGGENATIAAGTRGNISESSDIGKPQLATAAPQVVANATAAGNETGQGIAKQHANATAGGNATEPEPTAEPSQANATGTANIIGAAAAHRPASTYATGGANQTESEAEPSAAPATANATYAANVTEAGAAPQAANRTGNASESSDLKKPGQKIESISKNKTAGGNATEAAVVTPGANVTAGNVTHEAANATARANASESTDIEKGTAPVKSPTVRTGAPQKAGAGNATSNIWASECIAKCVPIFAAIINRTTTFEVLPPLNSSEAEEAAKAITEDCRLYAKYEDCLKPCKDAAVKEAVEKSGRGSRHFCAKKQEIVSSLPCLANTTVGDACEKDIFDLRQAVKSVNKFMPELLAQLAQKNVDAVLKADVITAMTDLCRSSSHVSSCARPIIEKSSCGTTFIDLFKKAFDESLEGLQSLVSTGQLEASFFPQECKEILAARNETVAGGASISIGNETKVAAAIGEVPEHAAAPGALAEAGPANACFLKCATEFARVDSGLADFFPPLSIKDGDRSEKAINERCEAFDKFKGCADACDDNVRKNLILRAFAGIQLYCDRKAEFIQQIPCLIKSNVAETCVAQISTTREHATKLSTAAPSLTTGENVDDAKVEFKSKLGGVCSASQSETKCTIPAAVSACGEFSATFVNDVYAATLEGVQDLIAAGAISASLLPEDCFGLLKENVTEIAAEATGQSIEAQPLTKPGVGTTIPEPGTFGRNQTGGNETAPGFEGAAGRNVTGNETELASLYEHRGEIEGLLGGKIAESIGEAPLTAEKANATIAAPGRNATTNATAVPHGFENATVGGEFEFENPTVAGEVAGNATAGAGRNVTTGGNETRPTVGESIGEAPSTAEKANGTIVAPGRNATTNATAGTHGFENATAGGEFEFENPTVTGEGAGNATAGAQRNITTGGNETRPAVGESIGEAPITAGKPGETVRVPATHNVTAGNETAAGGENVTAAGTRPLPGQKNVTVTGTAANATAANETTLITAESIGEAPSTAEKPGATISAPSGQNATAENATAAGENATTPIVRAGRPQNATAQHKISGNATTANETSPAIAESIGEGASTAEKPGATIHAPQGAGNETATNATEAGRQVGENATTIEATGPEGANITAVAEGFNATTNETQGIPTVGESAAEKPGVIEAHGAVTVVPSGYTPKGAVQNGTKPSNETAHKAGNETRPSNETAKAAGLAAETNATTNQTKPAAAQSLSEKPGQVQKAGATEAVPKQYGGAANGTAGTGNETTPTAGNETTISGGGAEAEANATKPAAGGVNATGANETATPVVAASLAEKPGKVEAAGRTQAKPAAGNATITEEAVENASLPSSCAVRCAATFALAEGGVTDFFPPLSVDEGATAAKAITKRCGGFDAFTKCVESCNETTANDILKPFSGFRVYCERKQAYLNELPCLANSTITTACKEEILATRAAVKDLNLDLPQLFAQATITKDSTVALRSKLGAVCKASNKETRCTLPIAVSQCGDFPLVLVNDMFAETLRGVEEMVNAGTASSTFLPAECIAMVQQSYIAISVPIKPKEPEVGLSTDQQTCQKSCDACTSCKIGRRR